MIFRAFNRDVPSCSQERAPSGLVTGPQAQIPRAHSRQVAGPGCLPQGRAVGGGRVPSPGHPSPRQEALPPPPPWHLCAAPTARKESFPERALRG